MSALRRATLPFALARGGRLNTMRLMSARRGFRRADRPPLSTSTRLRPQPVDLGAPADRNAQEELEPGSTLKVVSWNLDHTSFNPSARASAAMDHLKQVFGEAPRYHVVMLQEVNQESLEAIQNHEWVRRNFFVSHVEPPKFVGNPDPYTAISRGSTTKKKRFRLCTTHFEYPKAYHSRLRALIFGLLKGTCTHDCEITGGIVGACNENAHHWCHTSVPVNLRDVWEDWTTPPVSRLDIWHFPEIGMPEGHTWGYQSLERARPQRVDKFSYTGAVETFAASESHRSMFGAQDVAGKQGRVGIGIKAEVEAWSVSYVRNAQYPGGRICGCPPVEEGRTWERAWFLLEWVGGSPLDDRSLG
ncbi:hypothetical protein B0H66DRAFT_620178 [Apodospora peruviana]|uniref:Endonuclease/exonuclease/phosphatase domain-containing protein n=1 Tax=Apodospora peruviana TaxID=516989 RepID=A0AAE0ICN6_9PEZI|nr:hypothetical protein B0H66DRAFT_620178 [Apodospora peruviana]